MENQNRESCMLASYSTYKALYDEHKNAYDIVAEFINDAIRDFTGAYLKTSELRELVEKKCGILVPEVVIDTAAGKLECINKRGDNCYIDHSKYETSNEFEKKREESSQAARNIFVQFHSFLSSMSIDCSEKDADLALMNYLLDDNSGISNALQAHISAFIVKGCDADKGFNDALNNIRKGHCLLLGLTNNVVVGETNTWKSDLVIYLDTEILFNIQGYNGKLNQKIAYDFLNVVKRANTNKNYIRLRYFEDTQNEIKEYFTSVKYQILSSDKLDATLHQNTARRYLLKKCRTESDIIEEEGDFFKKLDQLNIHLDNTTDFHKYDNAEFNLEPSTIPEKYVDELEQREKMIGTWNLREDDDFGAERRKAKVQKRIRAISNINILRKGRISYDYRYCEYIFVTGKYQTIRIGKELLEEWITGKSSDGCEMPWAAKRVGANKKVAGRDESESSQEKNQRPPIDYAVSMYQITNTIWYRLNNMLMIGDNAKFPTEIDALVRAQMVLANMVQKNVNMLYSEAKSKLVSGERTVDELAGRLQTLSERWREPEDITVDNLKDDLTLISIEDIDGVENENTYLRAENEQLQAALNNSLKAKGNDQKTIDDLKANNASLEKKLRIREIQDHKELISEKIAKNDKAKGIIRLHRGIIRFGIIALLTVLLTLVSYAFIKGNKIMFLDPSYLSFVETILAFALGIIFNKKLIPENIVESIVKFICPQNYIEANKDMEELKGDLKRTEDELKEVS